jgi:hypothetical protein
MVVLGIPKSVDWIPCTPPAELRWKVVAWFTSTVTVPGVNFQLDATIEMVALCDAGAALAVAYAPRMHSTPANASSAVMPRRFLVADWDEDTNGRLSGKVLVGFYTEYGGWV